MKKRRRSGGGCRSSLLQTSYSLLSRLQLGSIINSTVKPKKDCQMGVTVVTPTTSSRVTEGVTKQGKTQTQYHRPKQNQPYGRHTWASSSSSLSSPSSLSSLSVGLFVPALAVTYKQSSSPVAAMEQCLNVLIRFVYYLSISFLCLLKTWQNNLATRIRLPTQTVFVK
jgi:hypothetical protein